MKTNKNEKQNLLDSLFQFEIQLQRKQNKEKKEKRKETIILYKFKCCNVLFWINASAIFKPAFSLILLSTKFQKSIIKTNKNEKQNLLDSLFQFKIQLQRKQKTRKKKKKENKWLYTANLNAATFYFELMLQQSSNRLFLQYYYLHNFKKYNENK